MGWFVIVKEFTNTASQNSELSEFTELEIALSAGDSLPSIATAHTTSLKLNWFKLP